MTSISKIYIYMDKSDDKIIEYNNKKNFFHKKYENFF